MFRQGQCKAVPRGSLAYDVDEENMISPKCVCRLGTPICPAGAGGRDPPTAEVIAQYYFFCFVEVQEIFHHLSISCVLNAKYRVGIFFKVSPGVFMRNMTGRNISDWIVKTTPLLFIKK